MEDNHKRKPALSRLVPTFLSSITAIILILEFLHQYKRSSPDWVEAFGITGVALIFLSLSKSSNLISPTEDGTINLPPSGYIYAFIAAALLLTSLTWKWFTI